MYVLGLNVYHGDSSAALLAEGQLVAAIEEERLNRIKHWAGFPAGAIASVLARAEIPLDAVSHVAVARDPRAHLLRKSLFVLRRRPALAAIRARLKNLLEVEGLETRLRALPNGGRFAGRIHNVEHHRAHLASAFLCSPYERAACLTVDGFGDFLSSMSAKGEGSRLSVLDEVPFPHSLGLLYTALTQYLGFPHYGDEFKVMGLSAYGRPTLLDALRRIVRLRRDGRFETDPDYFLHASEGVTMSWDDGAPVLGPLWSRRFEAEFGPPRAPEMPIAERHLDLAASLQALYEEVFLHRLRSLQKRTGLTTLCLAGGCALNAVANGLIRERTDFRDVYIQPAAGDAGTALGAALYVRHCEQDEPRDFVMTHPYWGEGFDDARIAAAVRARYALAADETAVTADRVEISRTDDFAALAEATAAALADGAIVGWFQGRAEWGPRALGNRSILADPRRAAMKDRLNARIKRREGFRPFAPSILEEKLDDYFEDALPDAFMLRVFRVRREKRDVIPAVVHADGTARVQTVTAALNPRFRRLLEAFDRQTGVPVLLNTSFNDNEPIVNTPEEALDCFERTAMDVLVLGDWMVRRGGRPRA